MRPSTRPVVVWASSVISVTATTEIATNDLMFKSMWLVTSNFPAQSAPPDYERSHAERCSARHENQDRKVPGWTVAIQPRQIHRMKSVIEPTIPAGSPVVALHHLCGLQVHVVYG